MGLSPTKVGNRCGARRDWESAERLLPGGQSLRAARIILNSHRDGGDGKRGNCRESWTTQGRHSTRSLAAGAFASNPPCKVCSCWRKPRGLPFNAIEKSADEKETSVPLDRKLWSTRKVIHEGVGVVVWHRHCMIVRTRKARKNSREYRLALHKELEKIVSQEGGEITGVHYPSAVDCRTF